MLDMGGERKLRLNTVEGKRPRWRWLAPMPVTEASGALDLVFELESGDFDVELTLDRAAAAIGSIDEGLQTLGPVGNATFTADSGEQGPEAFLVVAGHLPIPVVVMSIAADAIRLAERLTIEPPISDGAPASLVWRSWSCLVPVAVTTTETMGSPIGWRVDYTGKPRGTATLPGQRDEGVVHVVRRIFDPGVDTTVLRSVLSPAMVADIDHRHPSHAQTIATALGEMVSFIRASLAERGDGRLEDDLDGRHFRVALSRWAASLLLEREDQDAADAQRTLALALTRQGLSAAVRFDADGQGQRGQQAVRGSMLAGSVAKDTPTGRARFADRW
jgi:hypothetical protein